MPLTDEEKAQLETLIQKAGDEPLTLPGYVPQKALVSRLADKDRAREAAIAEEAARRSQVEQALAERDARLKEFEDKGKSADQKAAEEVIRARQEKDALAKTLQAEREGRAQADAKARDRELQYRLAGLLQGAHNPRHALLAAMADHPGLGLEDDGSGGYKMTLQRDGLQVEKPEDALGEWWSKQTHLRVKAGPELPLGAAHGRHEPKPKDPTAGMTDAQAVSYAISRGITSTGRRG